MKLTTGLPTSCASSRTTKLLQGEIKNTCLTNLLFVPHLAAAAKELERSQAKKGAVVESTSSYPNCYRCEATKSKILTHKLSLSLSLPLSLLQ
jgi:hypothetical protein